MKLSALDPSPAMTLEMMLTLREREMSIITKDLIAPDDLLVGDAAILDP